MSWVTLPVLLTAKPLFSSHTSYSTLSLSPFTRFVMSLPHSSMFTTLHHLSFTLLVPFSVLVLHSLIIILFTPFSPTVTSHIFIQTGESTLIPVFPFSNTHSYFSDLPIMVFITFYLSLTLFQHSDLILSPFIYIQYTLMHSGYPRNNIFTHALSTQRPPSYLPSFLPGPLSAPSLLQRG